MKPLRASPPAPLALRLLDAARALGVSTRTVRRLIACGDLPASRIGRLLVVEVCAIEALLARTRVGIPP